MKRMDWILFGVGILGCLACVSGGSDDPQADSLKIVSVSVDNNYAVSLFSVGYSVELPDGGVLTGAAMSDQRIEQYDSADAKAFDAPDGSKVKWTFSATSLGEKQSFAPIETEVDGGRYTYHFTYDYDLATAKFTISHGWQL